MWKPQVALFQGPSTVVVAMSGELDASTVSDVERQLGELLAGVGADDVTIDLRQVTFLDSAGLRTVAALATDLADSGATIRTFAEGPARRLLEVTGLAEAVCLAGDDV